MLLNLLIKLMKGVVLLALGMLPIAFASTRGTDAAAQPTSPSSQVVPGGVNQYWQQEMDGITYGIFHADPHDVSLHWRDSDDQPYRSLGNLAAALRDQQRRVLLVMNAGIYSSDYTPAGLWIERGATLHHLNRRSGRGNFHIQPNGVFWLRGGKAYINTTAEYVALSPQPNAAVQSGPMLLIDGAINPRFVKGLSSPYKRNAVCLTNRGALYFIMTEASADEWPSFYRFAAALQRLGCQQALYLDGSISSWYLPGRNSPFHWAAFVGMIAVTQPE